MTTAAPQTAAGAAAAVAGAAVVGAALGAPSEANCKGILGKHRAPVKAELPVRGLVCKVLLTPGLWPAQILATALANHSPARLIPPACSLPVQ